MVLLGWGVVFGLGVIEYPLYALLFDVNFDLLIVPVSNGLS